MSKDYRHRDYEDEFDNYRIKDRSKGSNKYMNRKSRPKTRNGFKRNKSY